MDGAFVMKKRSSDFGVDGECHAVAARTQVLPRVNVTLKDDGAELIA